MLTVKNLTKIYQPKKGLPVTALDNVSLTFPDNGMVFLLGKSGSGKSTLLNLIGGLDDYTSGEIIIKGKSCNDFKQSDYNSYRNTFIGFIFQEFNVLEEYNVGKNISLALEIQDKTAPKEAVESVMEIVDLDKSYFERKISELSGGQKQRVAIARALIKNPDIILADEPTGALDSTTGKQVMETLKKVSQETLVIVVSHDRENAETYGDRIIELADGKVISDRVNISENAAYLTEENSGNLTLKKSKLPLKVGIKMGLSALKVKKLRLSFTVLLSFIAFTVFGLSTTATAFDIYKSEIETIKMNGENTLLIKSVAEGGYSLFGSHVKERGPGFSPEQIAEIERITGNKTLTVFEEREFIENYTFSFIDNFIYPPTSIYYADHLSGFLEVTEESNANLIAAAEGSRLPAQGNNKEIAISDYIADSFIECGLKYGGTEKIINNYESLLGEKILLSRSYSHGIKPHEMTIVGVYKTDVNKENYYNYKEKTEATAIDNAMLSSLYDMVITMGFVAENFHFPVLSTYIDNVENSTVVTDWTCKTSDGVTGQFSKIIKFSDMDLSVSMYLGGKDISELAEDEIILNTHFFYSSSAYYASPEEIYNGLGDDKKITVYHERIKVGDYKIAGIYNGTDDTTIYTSDTLHGYFIEEDSGNEYSLTTNNSLFACAPKNGGEKYDVNKILKASACDLTQMNIYWGRNGTPKTTLSDNEIILNAHAFNNSFSWQEMEFKKAFDNMEKALKYGRCIWNTLISDLFSNQVVDGVEVKVVGILFDEYNSPSIFSDSAFNAAVNVQSYPFEILIKLSDSQKKNNELFEYLSMQKDAGNGLYSTVKVFSSSTAILSSANYYTKSLKTALLYASLGISLFAGLLLMNFIGVSIGNKKKEIGVLRAIGASGKDVFKIFLSEGLFIGLINFILSYVALVIISVIVNHRVTISILMPGIIEAALMLALSIVVVVLATLAPILKIARKKPIDAINNR